MTTSNPAHAGSPLAYRPDIDGLRAVAIVPVVLFHAFSGVATGGFVGVDVFFVISGFLIAGIIRKELEQSRFTLGDFYRRRARRILPALLVVITATLIAAYAWYLPPLLKATGQSAIWSTLSAANLYFLLKTNYFAAPHDALPLLHLWSLGVEEQFYLVVPILLAVLYKTRRGQLLAVFAALSLASFLVCLIMTWAWPKGSFFLLPTRFWELGIGVMLAWSDWRPASDPVANTASVGGIALILASVFLFDPGMAFPGFAALVPCLGAAFVIAAGPNGVVNRALAARPFVWIGLISYSLYLWHWPILTFAHHRMIRRPDMVEALGLVALAVIAAVLSYRYVETPFRRGTGSVRRVLTLSAVAASAICAFAATTALNDGWSNRWSARSLAPLASVWTPVDVPDCRPVDVGLERDTTCLVSGRGKPSADTASLAPDVIAWGDSHMVAVRPAVANAAKALGVDVLVIEKHACPPILNTERSDMPVWHRCAQHNSAVLENIARLRPASVFLAGRWAHAESGQPYGEEPGGRVRFYAPDRLTSAIPLSASLPLTVSRIKASGSSVIIMGSIPEVGFDVPTALARAEGWSHAASQGSSIEAYRARQAKVRAILADLRGERVSVIDPSVALCDRARCRIAEDGVPLYIDGNHLSATGALRLTKAVRQAIEHDLRIQLRVSGKELVSPGTSLPTQRPSP